MILLAYVLVIYPFCDPIARLGVHFKVKVGILVISLLEIIYLLILIARYACIFSFLFLLFFF